jgi:hypothetical protein
VSTAAEAVELSVIDLFVRITVNVELKGMLMETASRFEANSARRRK